MPYLFSKYAYPVMKKLFQGEMKLYHIFHAQHSDAPQHYLISNQLPADRIKNVESFIKDNLYPQATIIKHLTFLPNGRHCTLLIWLST